MREGTVVAQKGRQKNWRQQQAVEALIPELILEVKSKFMSSGMQSRENNKKGMHGDPLSLKTNPTSQGCCTDGWDKCKSTLKCYISNR